MNNINGHEVVFKALVGSRAFSLANTTSDWDYKVCVLPFESGIELFKPKVLPHKNVEFNIFTTNNLLSNFFHLRLFPVWFTDYMVFDAERFPEIKWFRENREALVAMSFKKMYLDFLNKWEDCKSNYLFSHTTELYITYWISCIFKNYTVHGINSFHDSVYLVNGPSCQKTNTIKIKNNVHDLEACINLIMKNMDFLKENEHKMVSLKDDELVSEFNRNAESLLNKFSPEGGQN